MTRSKQEHFREWIGREISVVIDRPAGSAHPDYPALVYPVNYGYVPNTRSDVDHEEIDAYVLGPQKPLETFTGRVIGVIVREADEIKLIVSDGRSLSREDIERFVHFQEKFFSHTLLLAE
ncbi:MAG: inorganic diphosphatase [Patescibacteria group bacterium]